MNDADKEAAMAAFECALILGLFTFGIWIVSLLDISLVP